MGETVGCILWARLVQGGTSAERSPNMLLLFWVKTLVKMKKGEPDCIK